MLKDIIIEGVDRLGKDSLISGLIDRLGFFQEIHYQRPRICAKYRGEAFAKLEIERPGEPFDPERGEDLVTWNRNLSDCVIIANKRYQEESFKQMFRMLSGPGNYILNRAHLGEYVYAPRYRKYGGDYVFELERQFTNDHGSKFADTTLLVLLTTSDFSFIEDDGLSFDFDKKEEEQEDFKRAFEKSTIKNKLMIDVSEASLKTAQNQPSRYRPKEDILREVIEAYIK